MLNNTAEHYLMLIFMAYVCYSIFNKSSFSHITADMRPNNRYCFIKTFKFPLPNAGLNTTLCIF